MNLQESRHRQTEEGGRRGGGRGGGHREREKQRQREIRERERQKKSGRNGAGTDNQSERQTWRHTVTVYNARTGNPDCPCMAAESAADLR